MSVAFEVQACQSVPSRVGRAIRACGFALLLLIALAECGIAALMVAGVTSIANLLFLVCAVCLLAAAVISVWAATIRPLLAVQASSAAAVLALFFAVGSGRSAAGPSVTLHGATYSLTLTIAALLFMALLLGRLLRPASAEDQRCNCG